MKQKLEQLIEELSQEKKRIDQIAIEYSRKHSERERDYGFLKRGEFFAYGRIIDRLREVLSANADISSNGQTSTSGTDDTTEQV